MMMMMMSGFGGLEVVCCPLVLKFMGLHPAEAVGFLG
jgi:Mg/Co/Ni transporter MgtE